MPSHLSHPGGSTLSSLKHHGTVRFNGQVWSGCVILAHSLYMISRQRLRVEYKGTYQTIVGVHQHLSCVHRYFQWIAPTPPPPPKKNIPITSPYVTLSSQETGECFSMKTNGKMQHGKRAGNSQVIRGALKKTGHREEESKPIPCLVIHFPTYSYHRFVDT